MDKKVSPRDKLYEQIISSEFTAGIKIKPLLESLQSYNLLCDNEVQYYDAPQYKNMSSEDLYSEIQKRVMYHRSEELSIKSSIMKKGGFISVANGSRVQGTTCAGGLQPDYIVDTTSKEIKSFINSVAHLKNENMITKMDKVGEILRQNFIHKTEYEDPIYLALLKKYREAELEVPLSEYIKINRGVCREISILTCIALNTLGLESYYYYAKVKTVFDGIAKEEDHAVVAISVDNEFLIADNYFKMFNKQKLSELENPSGVECLSGLMYDRESKKGEAHIIVSRLYPETRHNAKYIK